MNSAIVRTSDLIRQLRVHASTSSAANPVLLKPTRDRIETVSSISGRDCGCAKHRAPQPIATYVTLVFLHSMSHAIEIARFYWSARVRCDIIETRVTCHDLLGIGDRMREGRRSCMVIVSGNAVGCCHPRIWHGGTSGYTTHDVYAIWGVPRPG